MKGKVSVAFRNIENLNMTSDEISRLIDELDSLLDTLSKKEDHAKELIGA